MSKTCDELNEHKVWGKLPISNSCGQRGLSYQNMDCADDPDMACPLDTNMYITAVTASRELGAPPPMQCGPKYRIPSTGYWNFEEMQETTEVSLNTMAKYSTLFSPHQLCIVNVKRSYIISLSWLRHYQLAYANDNARVDVEGCCWWSRGVLQTKGRCAYGQLNYYLGKRGADYGRETLFPDVDFCKNPEVICGSQYKHELIWMSGLFEWVHRVQKYDQGGFNYIERLHQFADDGIRGPFTDDDFIKNVQAIVQTGCHNPPCQSAGCLNFPCDGAYPVDESAGVRKAFRTMFELDLWDIFLPTPGGSNPPSPSPTQCQPTNSTNCTDNPTMSPVPPTASPSRSPVFILSSVPSESPTRLIDARLALFEELRLHLNRRRVFIEEQIFVSETKTGQWASSELYSLDGFLNSLKDLAIVGVNDEQMFYIGQGATGNFDVGLVNVALFLAHAMTRGISWDTCEEVNHHLVNGKLPLSNSCGQHGKVYAGHMFQCPLADAAMECAVDVSMNVQQTSVGNSESPPFFCAPTSTHPFTGYYDPISDQTISTKPFANAAGQANVEGMQ